MQTRRQLPNNVAELQALLSAQFVAFDALANEHNEIKVERDALKKSKFDDQEEIKRLTLLIAKLKRMAFGQKSEKLHTQIDQLVLELEEMHIAQGAKIPASALPKTDKRTPPKRRELPGHLPRDTQTHMPDQAACPDCGGDWLAVGEDVSEVLEYVPASYRVIRHVRPRMTCTCCSRMAQAPAPSRPIARSSFGPGLIGHIIVAKYMDHLPIYRQCQQAEREGIEFSESTVGDMIGGVHHLFRPLMDPTAKAFTRRPISRITRASCKQTPTLGTTKFTRLVGYLRPPVGHTPGASFTIFTILSPRRSRHTCWPRSVSSTKLKRVSVAAHPNDGETLDKSIQNQLLRR